jgi:hypothetical protein
MKGNAAGNPLARLSQLAASTVLLAARHRSMADEANATSRIVIWTSSKIALTWRSAKWSFLIIDRQANHLADIQ